MALPKNLEEFLDKLATEAPELFRQLLGFLVNFYDEYTGGNTPAAPKPAAPGGPLNVLDEDGSGSHTMISTGPSEAVRLAVREGIADGIVKEKAMEWLKGLLLGLSVASFGATGAIGSVLPGAVGGTAAAGAAGCATGTCPGGVV